MKSVYLFRHGKSDWGASYESDADRPLSKRGKKAARAMGAWFATVESPPDLIVCSAALRTRDTVRVAAKAAGWSIPTTISGALYDASWHAYLDTIRASDESISQLMLVGHEPACSELIHELTGAAVRFSTAAMVRIDLEIGAWRSAASGCGELIWLLPPRTISMSNDPA